MLYAVIGGATTTLTGLLAVALSINLRKLIKTPTHAARSREALAGFLILILLSILILIPGQEQTLLGIELGILGLVSLAVGTSLQYLTLGRMHKSLRRGWIVLITCFESAAVFGIIGGGSYVRYA
jgi:hypothetical protein